MTARASPARHVVQEVAVVCDGHDGALELSQEALQPARPASKRAATAFSALLPRAHTQVKFISPRLGVLLSQRKRTTTTQYTN